MRALHHMIAVLVSLAACSAEDEIGIEVRGTSDTTKVELFIVSKEVCDRCPGIRPKGASSVLAGTVYFRDPLPSFEDEVDDDRVAHFRLRAGDLGETKVKQVVAIGWGPGGITGVSLIAPFDVAEGPFRILAELDKVNEEVLSDQAPDDDERVQVWSAGGGAASCIGLETWDSVGSSTRAVQRTFVVPDDDRDCDAVAVEKECRPEEYATSILPALETSTCFGRFATTPTTKACMLGGEYCVDGDGPQTACGPTGYCVADELCDQCANLTPSACIDQLFESSSARLGSPALDCQVPVVASQQGGFALCDGYEAAVPIDLSRYFTTGHSCSQVELTRLGQVQWGDGVFFDAGKFFVAPGIEPACTFKVGLMGVIPEPGLRVLATKLAVTNGKHLILPMTVRFVAECGAPFVCKASLGETSVMPADPIASCAL